MVDSGAARGRAKANEGGHTETLANGLAPANGIGHPVTSDSHLASNGNGRALANGKHAPPGANGHAVANAHSNGNGHAAGNSHAPAGLRLAGNAAWGVAGGVVAALVAQAPALPRVEGRRRETNYLLFGKRLMDLAGASVALLITAPLMIVLAIVIKLESRGPVFYRSTRIGRGGRPFTFYKLRSMVEGADQNRHHLEHLNEQEGPVFKISRDPRVTRVGRWLRTTSIDEIPQFVNVLRGEMSLVGPRPPLPEEVSAYETMHMRRLEVRPGITCLWQISGRSRIGFKEWMQLDLEYIRHQSFWLDVRILLRTIPAVMSRDGAY